MLFAEQFGEMEEFVLLALENKTSIFFNPLEPAKEKRFSKMCTLFITQRLGTQGKSLFDVLILELTKRKSRHMGIFVLTFVGGGGLIYNEFT